MPDANASGILYEDNHQSPELNWPIYLWKPIALYDILRTFSW